MCVNATSGARVRDANLVWEALHGRQAPYRDEGPMLACLVGVHPVKRPQNRSIKTLDRGASHGMMLI